jgi:hypothetical protein
VAKQANLTDRITESLGRGYSIPTITTSAIVTLLVFFYIFMLASTLSVQIYGLINRVTFVFNFQFFLISIQLDKIIICIAASVCLLLIFRNRIELVAALIYVFATCLAIIANNDLILTATALLSFPWLTGVLLFSRYKMKGQLHRRIDPTLILNYVALTAICLGVESAVLSIIPILSPRSILFQTYNYAYYIYILFSIVSPFLLAVLVFCVPAKVLLRELIHFMGSARNKITVSVSRLNVQPHRISSRNLCFYLSLAVSLSIILTAIPHIPSVNKNNQQIGTDTDVYVKWETSLLNSSNVQQFLENSFSKIGGGDRPLSVLIFLSLAIASGEDLSILTDSLPTILGPLLVLATFFLSRELTSNDLISLFAAFLTAVSLQIMVGLFAGYYSNWFAVTIGYFTMTFMLRYLKRGTKTNLSIFLTLLILILFSHAYTWTIFVIVIGTFLGLVARLKLFKRRRAAILFLVVLISVAIDITRVGVLGSKGAFESDTSIAQSQGAGLHQFRERWSNLTETVWTYYGGLMSNFIIYSLAIYWLIRSRIKEVTTIFIMAFLSIGILPLVFSGWVIQSRVLYDIPFQIPAAIGIYFMTKSRFGAKLVIPSCIWLVAMCLWAATNLTLE